MRITIDWDNTVAVDRFPEVGPEVPDASHYLTKLHEEGHILILNTCREGAPLTNALDWLMDRGLHTLFASVNAWDQASLDYWGNNPRKVLGDLNVDDKNVGCPLIDYMGVPCVDWREVYDQITARAQGIKLWETNDAID